MTNETELLELEQRLLRLPFDAQLQLFERALANERRKYEEARAEVIAFDRELRANEELQRALTAPFKFPPEAKRAAG